MIFHRQFLNEPGYTAHHFVAVLIHLEILSNPNTKQLCQSAVHRSSTPIDGMESPLQVLSCQSTKFTNLNFEKVSPCWRWNKRRWRKKLNNYILEETLTKTCLDVCSAGFHFEKNQVVRMDQNICPKGKEERMFFTAHN